jgi:tetratricopeptide (TPR) repeat protein
MLKLLIATAFLMSPTDLDTGRSLRQEGRFEEAIEHFEGMLSTQHGDPEAQLELGHTLALAGHYDRAFAAYAKLGESGDPKWRIESSKWRGLTHLYRGEISKAVAELERQAEMARQAEDRAGEVFATWYRGHIRTVLAQFGEANQAFLDALELAPNDFNVLHLAGVMAAHQGDEGSLRYQAQDLEQMVRQFGERSHMRRVYHLQAEVSLLQEKPEKALREIKKALELLSHPLYHETAARIYLALDDPSAAEDAYRQIVTSTDERLDIPLYYPKALIGLARALVDQEKRDEALPYYEKFLVLWGEASESLPEVEDARSQFQELSAVR